MQNLQRWRIRLLAFALLAGPCFAQNPPVPKFYKLDFTVREVDGAKTLNARTYSMLASTADRISSVRVGSKVPVPTSPGSSQISFVDLGVNIDCRAIRETQDELSLDVSADVSSAAPESLTSGYSVIRQNKWNSGVVVPFKKTTVIFSSDDITSKRQIQLELTATVVK